jgi:putative FmdB family regulatory protein
MPIYEYKCDDCGNVEEKYFHNEFTRLLTIKCPHCFYGICHRVISTFNTGPQLLKKMSGVDDTDDLTLGKIVADKTIPAEFSRKIREKNERVKKFDAELRRRRELHKFRPHSGEFD